MKPILGIEAYISATDRFDKRDTSKRDDNTSIFNHIILLAQNKEGVKNLNKLSEIAWTEGYYHKPRIDREILAEYKEGLIVLSGCMNGLISKAIERGEDDEARMLAKWFATTFGDNFYMEIQPHNPQELNHKLLEIADAVGIKPVVTADCHFSREEERALEEAMLILSTSPKPNKEVDFEKSRQINNVFERFNYLYPDRKISFEHLDVYVMDRAKMEEQMAAQGITRTDIYDNTVAISDSIEEYATKHNIEFSTTDAEGIAFTHNNQLNVLFVSTEIDIIAHEAIHLKNMIFDHTHMKMLQSFRRYFVYEILESYR
jgi:DNA polymerase-3 subunit alpha